MIKDKGVLRALLICGAMVAVLGSALLFASHSAGGTVAVQLDPSLAKSSRAEAVAVSVAKKSQAKAKSEAAQHPQKGGAQAAKPQVTSGSGLLPPEAVAALNQSDSTQPDQPGDPQPKLREIVFPIAASVVHPGAWTQDQGVDISTQAHRCGADAPLVAMGEGDIVDVGIQGFGQWAPVLHVTAGPLAGRYLYYGHAKPNVVGIGSHVQAGQSIAQVGCGQVGISSGPHLEIGIWPKGQSPASGFPTGSTSSEMLKILKEAYRHK